MKTVFDSVNIDNLKSGALNSISFEDCQSINFSIPMLVSTAIEFSNNIVDEVPRESSADHISCFKTLIDLLTLLLSKHDPKTFNPYFQKAISLDERIATNFTNYYSFLFDLNSIISVKNGIWNAEFIGENLFMTLNHEHRRNALHVLRNKANYLSYSKDLQKLLTNKPFNPIKVSLEEGLTTLDPIKNSLPIEWNKLLLKIGINENQLISFNAFISFLLYEEATWYTQKSLLEKWEMFISEYNQNKIDEAEFDLLLQFFTLSVKESSEWGTAAPFISINSDWIFFWPFFKHFLHPCLSILNLIHRKKSKDWSTTIGAGMSRISEYIISTIEKNDNLLIVAEISKAPIGDIDIGIYDLHDNHLCLVEVKTVFDKYRTNYQYSNLALQKINFSRVQVQLDRIEMSIKKEQWRLEEIFNDPRVKTDLATLKISKLLLTWWDIVKVPESINSNILSCNFSLFNYLLPRSKGNLDTFCNSLFDLGNLYCPYINVKTKYDLDGNKLELFKEMQSDILPPKTYYSKKINSNLVIRELEDIAKFPDDWELHEGMADWKFYS